MNEIRDNNWLSDLLADIWYKNFSDVPQVNDVKIKFGSPAKTRLGSIKWGRKPIAHNDGPPRKRSIITITGYFKHILIPENVVRAVIAHELVHYAHGFSSPLPQLHKHPHKGGIVDKELVARGLGKELKFEKSWMKANWINFLQNWATAGGSSAMKTQPYGVRLRRRQSDKRYPSRKRSLWDLLKF